MKYVILLFLLVACTAAMAQTTTMLRQEADMYYLNEQYVLAISYYQQLSALSDQQADVNYQLAESYRKVFNYSNAEAYYLKVFYQAPLQFPLSLYYYAMMLKLRGEFDDSIIFFSDFIYAYEQDKELAAYVEQAIVDRAGSEMAKLELSKKGIVYPINSLSINSSFNDYAPALLDSNRLVITSGRVKSNRAAIDHRYGEAFTNNFYFTKLGNDWQDQTKQFFQTLNTKYNDGPGCFTGKGDKYYFTVCGKDGPQCRIFLSVFENNKWSEPKPLNNNINFKSYDSKHPGVSKGGDTLLFSTDRVGGFGKFDIWMSLNAGNDQWGPAMNLGGLVNTKLNELAPAFTAFSHIFFIASDGHQNYGGLDLYMVKRFSSGLLALYNLDFPFNSTYDDCFISFSQTKVYVSSNREGGVGGFDIYSVEIPSIISYISRLSLKDKDARGDVKLNAKNGHANNLDLLIARNEDRIEYENLTYEKKKIVDQMVLNRMANKNNLPENFKNLTEPEYLFLTRIAESYSKKNASEKPFAKTLLREISPPENATQGVSITGVLKDSITGKALPARKIILRNKFGEVLKTTSTNESGQFRFTQLISGQDVQVHLETLLPESIEKPIIINLSITASKNSAYSYENIYFDFDQYQLRPEATQVLNELATFLKNSPTTQVEVYAYADEKGTAAYNLILTQKRGQAVINYLKNKGVDETALAIIAKGSQENLNSNTDMQRQINRRVEFYLNGEQKYTDSTVKTYILKNKSTWSIISAATGIAIDVLKKMNAAMVEELQSYQPIRLPKSIKPVSAVLFFELL